MQAAPTNQFAQFPPPNPNGPPTRPGPPQGNPTAHAGRADQPICSIPSTQSKRSSNPARSSPRQSHSSCRPRRPTNLLNSLHPIQTVLQPGPVLPKAIPQLMQAAPTNQFAQFPPPNPNGPPTR